MPACDSANFSKPTWLLKPDSAQNVTRGFVVEGTLADVLLSRKQSFSDRVHLPSRSYGVDQIDVVLGVEALQHLLVHGVEHHDVR